MKLRIICLSIFVSIFCHEIYAISVNENIDLVAKELFLKTESIVIKKRAIIQKERFLDPVGRNDMYFEELKKQSPDLLDNTNRYKFGVLHLLVNDTIEKDAYTDFDIVNIMYNLCIDDYIEMSDSILNLVKKGLVKFEILDSAICQDFNLTNSVARNYNNPELQKLLKQIIEDFKSGGIRIPGDREDFIEELNRLISGEAWKNDLQYSIIKHPPLPNREDCR